MTFYDVAWPMWLIVTPLAFAIIEGFALTRDRREGATLSQHVRRWYRTDTHRGRTAFLAWFTLGPIVFLIWFIPHILGGVAA